MPKLPTLLATVQELPLDKPSQIFVGAPQNSKLSLKDDDLAAASAWIADHGLNVYIHAPYIINLAEKELPDDWAVKLLKKNLEAGAALGCRGVVVHVGKSKGADTAEATEAMRANILRALESATDACPLLLETPAGQGTELLRGQEEFVEFVRSFKTPRLRACLDTCHVFACGHKPVEFVDAFLSADPDLLRLIHFNDSMDICGACKDRHALIGTGKIGVDVLEVVAERAAAHSIPMVVE
jgi:deoxyribonuclease-4